MLVNGLLASSHFVRTEAQAWALLCALGLGLAPQGGGQACCFLSTQSHPQSNRPPRCPASCLGIRQVCSDGHWLVSSPPSITVEAGRTGLSSPRGPQPRREGALNWYLSDEWMWTAKE